MVPIQHLAVTIKHMLLLMLSNIKATLYIHLKKIPILDALTQDKQTRISQIF